MDSPSFPVPVTPRRVVTAPAASAIPAAPQPSSLVETLFSHPNVKIVSITASLSRPMSASPPASPSFAAGAEEQQRGTLWTSRLERVIAVAPFRIYRAPGSIAFLSCGSALQPIFPRSQCWCVDEASTKFVLQIRPPIYWRIELPDPTDCDKDKADDGRRGGLFSGGVDSTSSRALRDVWEQVLQFEKTDCPFRRSDPVQPHPNTPLKRRPWTPSRPSPGTGSSLPPFFWGNSPLTPRSASSGPDFQYEIYRASPCRASPSERKARNTPSPSTSPGVPTQSPAPTSLVGLGLLSSLEPSTPDLSSTSPYSRADETAPQIREDPTTPLDRGDLAHPSEDNEVPINVARPSEPSFSHEGLLISTLPSESSGIYRTLHSNSLLTTAFLKLSFATSPPPKSTVHVVDKETLRSTLIPVVSRTEAEPGLFSSLPTEEYESPDISTSFFFVHPSTAWPRFGVDGRMPVNPDLQEGDHYAIQLPKRRVNYQLPPSNGDGLPLSGMCEEESSYSLDSVNPTPDKPTRELCSSDSRRTCSEGGTTSKNSATVDAGVAAPSGHRRRKPTVPPSSKTLHTSQSPTPKSEKPSRAPQPSQPSPPSTDPALEPGFSRLRQLPRAIMNRACNVLLGPPLHLIALMLRVAARILAGQWRGLVFGVDETGDRMPVWWDCTELEPPDQDGAGDAPDDKQLDMPGGFYDWHVAEPAADDEAEERQRRNHGWGLD